MSDAGVRAETLDAVLAEIWSLGRQDPLAAAMACKLAIKRFPDAPVLWALRGRMFLAARDHERAAPALERALQLAPDDAEVRAALAETKLALGLPKVALEALDGAPSSEHLPNGLGRTVGLLRLLAGDFDGAVEALESCGAEPDLLRHARMAEAADRAQGLKPQDKRAFIESTEALLGADPASAEAIFAGLVSRAPGYGPAWVGLRGAIMAQGRPDPGFADAPAAVQPLIARKPAGRGLVFDPLDVIPVRPRARALTEVPSRSELMRTDDTWLTLEREGLAEVLQPTIPCDGPGDEVRLAYASAESFVAVMADAAIVGRGLVVDRSGALIEELQGGISASKFEAQWTDGGLKFDPGQFRHGFCPVQVFDEPSFLMAGPSDGAFGDWMVNFLPRLAMARRAGLDAKLVIRSWAPAFVRRTLAFLGHGEDRILEHNPRGVSVFRRLYVPSWPLPHRRRAVTGLLRGLEVDAPPRTGGPQRIYLSRENMKARPLTNEAEVRARFEERGFVTVQPERLALEELHALLSSASHVAGPYGSAFLNLAFCREKPTCLVCAPAYYEGFLREITLWLGSMDAPFGLVLGEPGEAGPLRKAPWTLDLGRLEVAIERVLDAS